MNNQVQQPFHYIGNKAKRFPQIVPHIPKCEVFFDCFGGSGVVGLNVLDKGLCSTLWYNELSDNVCGLFRMAIFDPLFAAAVERVNANYDPADDFSDGAAVYYKLRDDYNKLKPVNKLMRTGLAMLYVLVCRSFNNDIRLNSSGEFNLPFGKRNYFKPSLLKSFHGVFDKSTFTTSDDFSVVFENADQNDVVFVDPPYLNTTATYNNGWKEADEIRFLKALDELNERGVRFILTNTFKNRGKENEILIDWFDKSGYTGIQLNGSYGNSSHFKSDKPTVEMLIKNF